MKDRHEWTDSATGRRFVVEPSQLTAGATLAVGALTGEGPFDDQPVRREILRLAGRVEDLQRRLKVALEAHREADASLSNAASHLGRQALRGDRLAAENALLRRERALLVDLEKARAVIINGLLRHFEAPASAVEAVGRLNEQVAALHLEASGGIERPPGSACACILCRSEDDQEQVRQEVQLVGSAEEETCSACGEERETFEGRCHDCISSGRRGEGG